MGVLGAVVLVFLVEQAIVDSRRWILDPAVDLLVIMRLFLPFLAVRIAA